MPHELGGEMPGSRLMRSQITQDGLALFFAVILICPVQNLLCAGLVNDFPELECARHAIGESPVVIGTADGPASDDLGKCGYIFLCVTTINAQGMQLQDFPGKIFVQSDLLAAATPLRRWFARFPIFEFGPIER
jgi:hypothetical protein